MELHWNCGADTRKYRRGQSKVLEHQVHLLPHQAGTTTLAPPWHHPGTRLMISWHPVNVVVGNPPIWQNLPHRSYHWQHSGDRSRCNRRSLDGNWAVLSELTQLQFSGRSSIKELLRSLSILQASSRCQRLKQVGILDFIHIYHHLQTAKSLVVNCALIMALWKVFPWWMLFCTKDIKPLLKGGQMVSPVGTDTNQFLVNIRSSLRSRHNYSKQLLAAISEDLSR